jgi:hypothetical protein
MDIRILEDHDIVHQAGTGAEQQVLSVRFDASWLSDQGLPDFSINIKVGVGRREPAIMATGGGREGSPRGVISQR